MLEVRLREQAARWPRSSCVLAEGGQGHLDNVHLTMHWDVEAFIDMRLMTNDIL
jgi:hypothetical protein